MENETTTRPYGTVESLIRLHPFDKVREIILFALWREMRVDGQTTTDCAGKVKQS